MSGFFGVASRDDCVQDLFFGTDYQSHLGTMRGGLAVKNNSSFTRFIHDISNTQFRSKFDDDIKHLSGHTGIGVISDFEDQPILVSSHLGTYAIVMVGVVQNAVELAARAFAKKSAHFSEIAGGYVNPTELVATLINEEDSFAAGIANPKDFRNEVVKFALRARANHGGNNPSWTSYEKLREVIEKRMFSQVEDLLPLISFGTKKDSTTDQQHKEFVCRMADRGYTERQVRRLVEWYMRVNKAG